MHDHVLVAFDESAQSETALRFALSTFPDARITVLHVNDPREWLMFDDGESVGGFASETSFQRVQEAAQAVLESAESIADDYGVAVETAIETGYPADQIVAAAEERDAGHIVVGSHGRRGIERFLLGSVAERVARRSPTSVTIIREDPEA